MKVSADWVEGMRFIGKAGSGHAVIMEGSASGGETFGASPMEHLLLGMAGCSGIDVVHILRKMRQDVTDCKVELDADRADTEPKVFTHIRAVYTVTGRSLSEDKVAQAVALSADKYCSASVMLGQVAEISREIKVIEVA